MDHEDLTKVLDEVGLGPKKLPRSTLRNWARDGLVPKPTPYSMPGKQGRYRNWKQETVEEAAAVWVIRNLPNDEFWSPPSINTIKRIKHEADKVSEKLRSDPKSYKDVFRQQHDPKGDEFSYIISYDLHPFIVSWITTVEKVKKRKSVHGPAKVIFDWNHHLIFENGDESSELKFDGVKLEPSNQNTVTLHVGYTREVQEKSLAKMRTDIEKYGQKELSKEEFDEIERSAARNKKQKEQKKERMLFRL